MRSDGNSRDVPEPVGALVRRFHDASGLPVAAQPTLDVATDVLDLRRRLVDEEVGELHTALDCHALVAVADALGDLVYVAYGMALTLGIDLDAVIAEIHRSNLTKANANSAPVVRSDGKVLKGCRYSPPDIASVLGVAGEGPDSGQTVEDLDAAPQLSARKLAHVTGRLRDLEEQRPPRTRRADRSRQP